MKRKIEYSEHALKRIKQRSITRSHIRRCIIKGIVLGLDLKGREIKEIKINKKVLNVIYLKMDQSFLIITAFWKV